MHTTTTTTTSHREVDESVKKTTDARKRSGQIIGPGEEITPVDGTAKPAGYWLSARKTKNANNARRLRLNTLGRVTEKGALMLGGPWLSLFGGPLKT